MLVVACFLRECFSMKNAVFGILENRSSAEQLVDQLGQAGFVGEDISVLFADQTVVTEFADENATRAPEGAVTGASVGGIVGSAFGFLVGLGALFIPGAGPFLAVGPIVSALSVGAAAAAAGGMTGALIGMGVPEEGASDFGAKIAAGDVLVSVAVTSDEELQRVKDLLAAVNAEHVSVAGDGHPLV